MVPMEADTAGKIFNLENLQSVEVDATVSQASATDENAGQCMPGSSFSNENYESIKIVVYPGQITGMPYSLRSVLDERKRKLMITAK